MKLPIEYSDQPVTPFGGMRLMKEFMDQTNIVEQLRTLDLPQPESNRGYKPEDVITSFWLNIWAGSNRYVHCNWLRDDAVLKEIFAFKSMPSQSTYSRFFSKFDQARNTRVFPEMQKWFFDQINLGTVTIDFDSTVITREGEQEGAKIGYNPNRRGRNSHHPLMAFVDQTKMVANAWLRPGNTAASSNCEAFFHETFEHALKGVKVGLVRADSGFYTESLLTTLEAKSLNYIVAARAYQVVKHAVHSLTDWTEVCDGIDVAEFKHQTQQEGSVKRRHFVVRKVVKRRPEAGGKLLFEELPHYRYSIYVTNLELPVKDIWNVYNGRADCENRIKELKQDFGLESFCLKDFWATEASFRWIMVAYNLMQLFQHLALNQGKRHHLKTLRTQCFAIGGWVSKHARKEVLKLSLAVKKRRWIDQIMTRIGKLSAPYEISTA